MPQSLNVDCRSVLRLHMAVEQATLAHLAEAIASLSEQEGWDPGLCFQVDLVLEELVQNVITYGYPDGRQGEVEVSIECGPGILRMRVEDDGQAFNPLDLPVPDIESPMSEREIGGLGIHFARTLTDAQHYSRIHSRNCIELIKRLPDAPL